MANEEEAKDVIPKSLFNPSINRQQVGQNSCAWDELDSDRLKMSILTLGTSPASLTKCLPWRSRTNIERKVKSDEIKSFIAKWKVDKGKEAQTQFDQNLRDKKRKLEEVEEDVYSDGDDSFIDKDIDNDNNNHMRITRSSSFTNREKMNEENMSRFLQIPRVDVTPKDYFVSYRHSLATEVKWFLIDVSRAYFECQFIDPPWAGNEWERHPAFVSAISSTQVNLRTPILSHS